MAFSWVRLTERLRKFQPDNGSTGELESRAAVAMVLRFVEKQPELLLMRRAERVGDRWSGQISLPGGREEPGDESLLATAIRETREEVGLDLEAHGSLLGQLDRIQARARGELLSMAIAPFVFAQTQETKILVGEEAVEAFWFPLARAAAGEFDSTILKHYDGVAHELDCWHFEGRIIWGLTFEMLRRLLTVAYGDARG